MIRRLPEPVLALIGLAFSLWCGYVSVRAIKTDIIWLFDKFSGGWLPLHRYHNPVGYWGLLGIFVFGTVFFATAFVLWVVKLLRDE
ncbi:hypothetical protein [Rhizobium sp. LjRoot254]|uniref:hypothetical protein n=1 Tax=Rhizobium sp. LjRoot254 TaxID=3342297 RepID=UPI003ECF346A